MNRNTPYSFDLAPHETMKRSVFDLSHSHKTSYNVGQLIPVLVSDVLPGDTWSIATSSVTRLQTLLDPIMDDLYLDTYFFFIPTRLMWTHFAEFMGENKTAPWTQTTSYTQPQLTAPSGGWIIGTIADYMGIPTGVDGFSVDAIPFRAYAAVCSEWFRNENTTYPVDYTTDDTTVTGVNTGDQVTDVYKGGLPFNAAKYKDYFTSCLPAPQKGNSVMLPLGNNAPVYAYGTEHTKSSYPGISTGHSFPLRFRCDDGSILSASENYHLDVVGDGSNGGKVVNGNTSVTSGSFGLMPSNLYADMAQVTGTSVNQLRLAFQLQKMLELDARGGTRYIEKIKAHFGVVSPDARMQRPEYLGGHRIALSKISVPQTSGTENASGTQKTPQGTVAAYSVTVDNHGDFSKSFTEHGTLLGLCCVRYFHTYQQGLNRMWSKLTPQDYFWPMLANIGEVGVKNKEIFLTGTATDDQIFGYNEAWCNYRHIPNRTSGEMRSQATTSLDCWHLGDEYSSLPSLSSSWIQEDKAPVDRCLAVTSSVANQIMSDFHFDIKATRVMPTFSIPGLIDHH